MDDFTPGRTSNDDPARKLWVAHPSYLAAELQGAAVNVCVLAARRFGTDAGRSIEPNQS
jgi:hypothetical protein